MYRSKYEGKVAKSLESRGVEFDYEPWSTEYLTPVRSGYCVDCDGTHVFRFRYYTPDFVLSNGVVIEAKGNLKPSDRSLILDLLNTNEFITRDNFRILFMRNNKFGKVRKTTGDRATYASWAEKNNIECAVSLQGEVPISWLNQKF